MASTKKKVAYVALGLGAAAAAYAIWRQTRRGTLGHELLHMPSHLLKLRKSDTSNMVSSRYDYGDHHRQYVLLYRNELFQIEKLPFIFYVHGGSWVGGSPELLQSSARFFTDLGFDVAMPSYRLLPRYNYLHMREDLDNALLRTLQMMENRGWAGRPIVFGGTSAGAQLMAALLYDRERRERLGLRREQIAGFFAFAAPLDLGQMPASPLLRQLLGKRDNPVFQEANPASHLRGDEDIPLLCVHGTKDGMVPLASAESFVKGYGQQPGLVHFERLDGATHLESGVNWYLDNEDVVAKILKRWLMATSRLATAPQGRAEP